MQVDVIFAVLQLCEYHCARAHTCQRTIFISSTINSTSYSRYRLPTTHYPSLINIFYSEFEIHRTHPTELGITAMADPVPVAASIAGVAAVGAKVLTQLNKFIGNARLAPGNTQELAREVQELCSILWKLEAIFRDREHCRELSSDLSVAIDSCMDKFIQLGQLIQAHEIKDGKGRMLQQWKSWRWAQKEMQVTTLRSQLEAHRNIVSAQ